MNLMVFIMSVLVKRLSRILQAIVLVCCLHSLVARADFELTSLEALVDSGLLQVDATANLSLSDETQQALESGVDLRIQFLIELIKSRNWLWDTPEKEWEMLFTLHFHQLSGQYILAIPQSDNLQAFNTVEDALDDLASRLSFNLGYEESLQQQGIHYLRAKVKLDTEYLPAPLKLFSLVSGDWKLDSGWRLWVLEP